MAMSSGTTKSLHADPNVTPLIDVLLVLLIIFMVIVPVTPRGLTAMLPQPPRGAQTEPASPIVVEVLASQAGPVYLINGQRINGSSVAGKAGLVAELERIYAVRADKTLFVKGDPAVSFAAVAEAIDAGRAAGVDQIAILTPGTTAH
ncbi:MAG TPA: biopolymer transporter ExbD [Acidobacteriaceae bacterium]|nr:biopolymer transporter ExbD [Acidobacteriaceae bacterium]